MKKNALLLTLILISLTKLHGQMGGAYVVASPTNSGSFDDFASFGSAINALQNNTIVSDVYILLRDGYHSGAHYINNVTVPSGKHVYIESYSGNRDSITLKFEGFYHCTNFTIRNLTLFPSVNSNFLYTDKGLEITASENINFYNCIIDGDPTNFNHKNGLFFATSKGGSVRKCTFTNLSKGLIFSGAKVYFGSNAHSKVFVADSNIFLGIATAIRLGGVFVQGSLSFTNNYISDATVGLDTYGSAGSDFGISASSRIDFVGNKILNASSYGIRIFGETYNHNLNFINNQVGSVVGGVAIALYDSDSALIEHNTFVGLCVFDDVNYVFCLSNIFYRQMNTWHMSFESANNCIIDYNNYYNFANEDINWVKYNNSSFKSFNNYVFQTGQDQHSVFFNPRIVGTYNLYACNPRLMGIGKPSPTLHYDIDNEARDTLNPDIGPDEFKNSTQPTCLLYTYTCDSINPFTIDFINLDPQHINTYWDFGDGNTDTNSIIKHTYSSASVYNVMLVSSNLLRSDTSFFTIDLTNAQIEFVQKNLDTLFISPDYSLYQWYFNNTPIPGAVNHWCLDSLAGEYYCEFYSKRDCPQYSAKYNNIGILEYGQSLGAVYPNPAKDFIDVQTWQDGLTWTITSLNGITQLRGTFESKKERIVLNSLLPGVYVFTMADAKSFQATRIIKI